jgi:uncharacterized protein YPO0396
MQFSVFSTKSSESGYRLEYFETCNWGTFDKEIFRISPKGNTTLITGANGSGKTTFIQGLLTLIVPEKRFRFYEHQRTEESYVQGEYGDIETEAGGRQIQKLRDDKSKAYSVLLATFKSEEKFITLIQARWFSGSEMKRKYIIAFKPLLIEDDIKPFDPKGDWLKRLHKKYPRQGTKEIIIPFDGPSKYAEALLKVFGMRSPKALTLFDQTMRLKVLGSLDQFVRENMLEESKIEDDFQNLRSNYQKLLDAHREMQKAEKQLELLKPVVAKATELEEIKKDLQELSRLKETHPIYFSQKKAKFLVGEIAKEKLLLQSIKEKEKNLINELKKAKDDEVELRINIENNEVEQRIKSIKKDITEFEKTKTSRENNLRRYNSLAVEIDLAESPDESLFIEQIQQAKNRQRTILEDLNDSATGIKIKWAGLINEKNNLETQYTEKQFELDTLLKQKNNITGRVSEIRQEILLHTGASEREIPFIGELIQVLSKEKEWEMAIEKVLHSFALRIIVPEEFYQRVNDYVNDNNLKGRIIYERFTGETFINSMLTRDKESVLSKVEIKRQSEYADWIENQIRTHYNYICTTRQELSAYSKAVTIKGLIKSGTKHEKDDRTKALSKENYVLGWDNKEKREATRETLRILSGLIKEKKNEIFILETRQKRLEDQKDSIKAFLGFDNFTDINWKAISLEIQKLRVHKDDLEKDNTTIQGLKRQLEALQQEIEAKEGSKNKLIEERTTKNSLAESLETQQRDCEEFLERFEGIEFEEKFSAFENKFIKDLRDLSFENLELRRAKTLSVVSEESRSKSQKKQETELELQSVMQKFKRPDDEIMKEFKDWTSDTHKLGDNIIYVDDYIVIYDRIEKEELIDLKNKFKKYLNEDMISKMADFKTLLDSQEEQIRDGIDALNESLRNIDFKKNPKTFIQLDPKKNSNENLDKFRAGLVEWKPNISEYETTKDEQILEVSFKKIKALIDTLTENNDYRKYVTDVRNWLRFIAKEYHREDLKRPPKIYDNTGKLSSGEQAQITYTIMAAAIAYQYGILKDGLTPNSFRFICVDEAFAKQDEEKAEYLMDLTKKLNLQMLLVTPDDKIQIAEPFISAVHIVHRVNNRNSRIFDTTIEQAKKIIEEKTLATSDYGS